MKKTKSMRFDETLMSLAAGHAKTTRRSLSNYLEYAVEQQMIRDVDRSIECPDCGAVLSREDVLVLLQIK